MKVDKETFLNDIFNRMSLQQKIGQCVVVGMSGTVITNDLREAILRYQCGGVRTSPFMNIFRYFSDDKAKKAQMGEGYVPSMQKIALQGMPPYKTPEQYAEVLNELKDLAASREPAIPLHIVVDQEGDTSKDFARGGVVQFPSNMGLACTDDPDLTYRVSRMIAREMKASGFDMIHSPVVDVNINPDNPEIGRRAFSDNPEKVAAHAVAMMKGFKDEGVIAAAKHFPGRGDSATDAHHACPKLDVDFERLDRVELHPYKELITAGIDSIMAAHCLYPALDEELISTVSRKIIHGLLREKMGFTGLITTDSITMGALIDKYGVGESCARALAAGADVILMKAENQWRGEMFYTIERWVEEGKIDKKELDDKVKRILSLKWDYGLFEKMGKVDAAKASESFTSEEVIKTATEATEKAVMICRDKLSALPLDRTKRVLLINQQNSVKTPLDAWDHPSLFQEIMESNWPQLQTFETNFGFKDEKEDELVLKIAREGNFDLIICTNFYDRSAKPHRYPKVLIDEGFPVLLLTNTPYCIGGQGGLIPEAPSIILNMNLTPEGLRMMRRVLDGECRGKAQWPISNYDPLGLKR
ncbi:MAG: hypothetical protein JEY99_10110 [Spirochaetales bacterium]|nr:hypothetical protein [Spirochaetales bacterium]